MYLGIYHQTPLSPLSTLLQHNQSGVGVGVGVLQEWKESHQAEMANSNSAEQIELRIQFHGQIWCVSQACCRNELVWSRIANEEIQDILSNIYRASRRSAVSWTYRQCSVRVEHLQLCTVCTGSFSVYSICMLYIECHSRILSLVHVLSCPRVCFFATFDLFRVILFSVHFRWV